MKLGTLALLLMFTFVNGQEEAWDQYKKIKTPLFGDIVTFAHLPWIKCLENQTSSFDIGVVGIPFDNAVSFRTGARFGPNGIRQGSRRQDPSNAWSHYWKQNPYQSGLEIVDCGDIPIITVENNLAFKAMEAGYETLIKRSNKPKLLTFGGDHSIELPILRALNKVYGRITLIQIDSHIDTWSSGAKYGFSDDHTQAPISHGNMLWHASEENLLNDGGSIQVGIRTRYTNVNDLIDNQRFGFEVIPIEEFDKVPIEEIGERIKNRVGVSELCYLTFDIDSLDPSIAPGTGTPEVGGLNIREAKRLLRSLNGLNFVGADVVEVSPPFDSSELTQMAGAEISYELMNLLINSKGNSNKERHDEL